MIYSINVKAGSIKESRESLLKQGIRSPKTVMQYVMYTGGLESQRRRNNDIHCDVCMYIGRREREGCWFWLMSICIIIID